MKLNAVFAVLFAILSQSAHAGLVTLAPTGWTTTRSIGSIEGRWIANGTDTPNGISMQIQPFSLSSVNLVWSMNNLSTGAIYVPGGTVAITAADWNALPNVNPDGSKSVTLIVSPTWGAPAAGNLIRITTAAAGNVSAQWMFNLASLSNDGKSYPLGIAVPEPVFPAGAAFMIPFLCFARRECNE